MALMTKSNLQYDDYSWTAYGDDDPEVTGEPDSTLFNRNEGYEVLYLINKVAEIHNLEKVESGKKMERMIHDSLPGDIRRQVKVKEWIEKEWNNYD